MNRNATRTDRLAGFEAGPVLDVLVVGGGIVGSGIARDAALRGMRTALVEQNDFASGTSSRSSRLLHGGLRYLAQGRVGLVREASLEKRIVHAIAPHLAEPLPFLFPTYRGTPWKRWKLAIGVKVYDLLCGGRNFGKSRALSREGVLKHTPVLRADGLTGGVCYYDGFTNDARLVLDTLRSAAQHDAAVHNYVALEDAVVRDGRWHCRLCDAREQRSFQVSARNVVNATGPWADQFTQSQVELRLTKGVHLVVDHERLPVSSAVVMPQGDRILFAIPWGRRVILGTTDTEYHGPVGAPTCEPDDARYVLDIANAVFPGAKLNSGDIVSTWAGLRPLIAPRGKAGRPEAPSDISRSHQIKMPEPGWFDVAGGKLTTYRLMAEQAVDRIGRRLSPAPPPSRTADEPLLGPEDTAHSGLIPPEVSEGLVRHFCDHEWAVHLDDVMTRRTGWSHYHADDAAIAGQVSVWMGAALGWNEDARRAELQGYQASMAKGCGPKCYAS